MPKKLAQDTYIKIYWGQFVKQIYWQKYICQKKKKYKCSIFLNTDAHLLSFSPSVTMRDALSFEPGEMKDIAFIKIFKITDNKIYTNLLIKKCWWDNISNKVPKNLLEKFTENSKF